MIVFPATALTDVGSGRYTPISNYPLTRAISGFFNMYSLNALFVILSNNQ